MEATELKALIRKESGKGPARRLRGKGSIPAIFYARGEVSIPLSVNADDLRKIIREKKENVFIKLLIEGEGQNLEKLSMIKELQIEPLSRKFHHADFYEIRMDQKLTVDVPIRFVGMPVGVEMGGELQHLKRDLKVSCLPGALTDFIEVDVSALEIGHSLKVQDIQTPEGMTILDPGEVGVAMVAVVKAAPVAAAETAAAPADTKAKAPEGAAS